MSVPDIAHLRRRLASRFDAGCWTGLIVRAIPAREAPDDGRMVRTPDHYLGAAWPPVRDAPVRWPEAVVVGSPSPDHALAELFRHLPADGRLYLAGVDDVDAALAAEILLAADRNLEPYQREALAAFITAERDRVRGAIADRYSDRDPGFERFRDRVLGTPPR
jgi:hypothetical protein